MKVLFEQAGQRLSRLPDYMENEIALALVAGDSLSIGLVRYKIEWRRINPGYGSSSPSILFSVIELGLD